MAPRIELPSTPLERSDVRTSGALLAGVADPTARDFNSAWLAMQNPASTSLHPVELVGLSIPDQSAPRIPAEDGRMKDQTLGDGTTLHYDYGANGKVVSADSQSPDGTNRHVEFRPDGTIQSRDTKSPNGTIMHEAFGTNGIIESSDTRFRDGSRLHNEYDASGKLTTSDARATDGTTRHDVYDQNGNLQSEQVNKPDGGEEQWQYKNGKPSSVIVTNPDKSKVYFKYGPDGIPSEDFSHGWIAAPFPTDKNI
jgi:YD repeat-containing protein